MLLAACSPVGVLNAAAPRVGVRLQAGIRYEAGPRHLLDVCAPKRLDGPAPVVVFYYGGGWEGGDRAEYRFVGAALAARGVVTVVPDYRVYPAVRFPAFMDDAAAALAWTERHVGEFGGDTSRIFLMGHSAGGQIATLLALDPRYVCAAGGAMGDIAGVIGLAGPYDFLPLRSETLKIIFGPEAERYRSQPIHYVSAQAPPMLLAAGTADKVVDPGNAIRLGKKLTEAGVPVTIAMYPGIGHGLAVGGFSSLLAPFVPVRRDALDFIAAHGARGAAAAARCPDALADIGR